MTQPRSRFLGNAVALAVSAVVATALTLAQMKILAANLTMATFGLFASLRGLSLLVSMLAANGFPQLLVRFLPEHAAHRNRARALGLSAAALLATVALCVVLLAGVVAFAGTFFRHVPPGEPWAKLLFWFGVSTMAVAIKLVLYGGFNGLRRFGSQTAFETASLAAQVVWLALAAETLTLTHLFEITAVTSLATTLVAVPWYFRSMAREVAPATAAAAQAGAGYLHYWGSALGLSVVALAFTDVDRWVLSNVLALEALSLFHVASRVARLANRFIAIPVLAFQPEATRVHAEGRPDALEVAMRTFFKVSVLLAVLASAGIIVYAAPLIELASSREFAGARTTLWLLAASVPLTAMTAPLTAIMKAVEGVRSALYCDLAWAGVYLACLFVLTRPFGVEGAGAAQVCACLVQAVLAFRLATLRPRMSVALAALGKSLACGAAAFAPVVAAVALGVPLVVTLALAPAAVWIYFRLIRRSGVLSADERERLRQVAGGGRLSSVAGWVA
ncbi:MAG TPA: lipopolysaccharide biosynthesis protein [Candidatus Krumholzibacteria bacterium]|nr:lipopolysaccharide biosynthesis protein [Candidatus Krumholzibacteria bacterium]